MFHSAFFPELVAPLERDQRGIDLTTGPWAHVENLPHNGIIRRSYPSYTRIFSQAFISGVSRGWSMRNRARLIGENPNWASRRNNIRAASCCTASLGFGLVVDSVSITRGSP